MARILAIDYGTKRTGIAVTDPLKIISSPLDFVPSHQLETFLANYFNKEEVEAVVIGMPVNTDGGKTNATDPVNSFINRFKKVFPKMRLILHDERFTSKMAFDSMIEAGLKKKVRQNKGLVDKVSASIILQSYLDSIR